MLNIKRISNSRTNDLIAVLIASCELRLSQSQELQFRDAFLLWSSHWKMFQRVTLKNSHNFDKCQSAKILALLKRPKLWGATQFCVCRLAMLQGMTWFLQNCNPWKGTQNTHHSFCIDLPSLLRNQAFFGQMGDISWKYEYDSRDFVAISIVGKIRVWNVWKTLAISRFNQIYEKWPYSQVLQTRKLWILCNIFS